MAIDQHTFPAASIKRFCGPDGCVLVHDLLRNKVRRAGPKDDIFCAKRAWDHGSETGFMWQIEAPFQELANRIVERQVSTIGEADRRVVNEFFALWYMRSRGRTLTTQEHQAQGVTGGGLSKDQEEVLERHGVMFARAGGRFPARFLNGHELRLRTYRYAQNELAITRWGIIEAQEGEFLVPDVPLHTVIPLTPTRCVASPALDGMITRQNLTEINRNSLGASRAYFFARDFTACPVWQSLRA
ncbi:MAG TPA: hypothetical protein VND87_00865 [Stellaceae bacterium]|nr:hypothetical protein [Stellaceae bacterium]